MYKRGCVVSQPSYDLNYNLYLRIVMLYLNFIFYINYKFKVIIYFHIYNMFKKFCYYYLFIKKIKVCVSTKMGVVSRKKCRNRASLIILIKRLSAMKFTLSWCASSKMTLDVKLFHASLVLK